jgi:hypothetical protein
VVADFHLDGAGVKFAVAGSAGCCSHGSLSKRS